MSRAVLFWVALLMFVMGGTMIWLGVKNAPRFTAGSSVPMTKASAPRAKNVSPADKAKWLTQYELTDRSERKVGSQDLAGKLHLASFFFASCPANCRTQNQHFADLEREFGKQGVKFVAISCDPENDTPEKLREYAQIFNASKDSWYFLTGDLTYTRRIAGEVYGVALDRKTHVERLILVDQKGKIRGAYAWADSARLNELRTDIRSLLADKEAQTVAEMRDAKRRQAAADDDESNEAETADDASTGKSPA